jgi:hypothetical protein
MTPVLPEMNGNSVCTGQLGDYRCGCRIRELAFSAFPQDRHLIDFNSKSSHQ